MRNFNWECPFCKKSQVVTETNSGTTNAFFYNSEGFKQGKVGLEIVHVTCSNKDCKELSILANLKKYKLGNYQTDFYGESLQFWQLRPESTAKILHSCVPIQLAQDYYEACKIRDLSPKASATLARRCIQGMIRDFCKISKNSLYEEINELKKLAKEESLPKGVAEDTIEGIDHVRSIGNIGAHFEKDINVIVDVDPGEAQALIELIEMLFEEWYVARHSREQKLKNIGVQKAELKALATTQTGEQDNIPETIEKPATG